MAECIDDNELMLYASGGLAPADRARVEAHLDVCEGCRRVVAELALHQSVGDITAPPPPAEQAPPAGESVLPLAGDVLGGRFHLSRSLGRGGMGVVFAAADKELGIDVALKLLTPRYARDARMVSLLLNEILVARKVTHRNVCRVYDLGSSGTHRFITMELIRGRTLEEVLQGGRLPPREAARIFSEIAAGLAAAHAQGVIHRDLKPSNVMLDDDDTPKIMDFGLASEETLDTSNVSPAGTPLYWAPEQARGESPRSPADVYSAGVMGFRLFTGRPAAEAKLARARKLIPSRYRGIIARCLEPEAENRFSGGAALHSAIERARKLPRNVALGVALITLMAVLFARPYVNDRLDQRPTARARQAFAELELGHTEKAGHLFDALLAEEDHSDPALFSDVLFGVATTGWLRSRSPGLVIGSADAALRVHQAPARQAFLTALAPLSAAHWGEALELLSQSVPDVEAEPYVLYGRFESLYHSGRPREAMEPYNQILERRPHFRLGYDHVLDFGLATGDARVLSHADQSPFLRNDQFFSSYAVMVELAIAGPEKALPLTDGTIPQDFNILNAAMLKTERVKLLLLTGRVADAASSQRVNRAANTAPSVDALGFDLAVGDGTSAARCEHELDLALLKGEDPNVEFRARVDMWVLGRFTQSREALDANAQRAVSLPVLNRDFIVNYHMLRALSAGSDRLPELAGDAFPPVASAVRARVAEERGLWLEAADGWTAAISESLDDRWSHLLRVFLARDLQKAGELEHAKEVCAFELRPNSLKNWSMFPARAECALLNAEIFVAQGQPMQAKVVLDELARTRAIDADDTVQTRLKALRAQLAAP